MGQVNDVGIQDTHVIDTHVTDTIKDTHVTDTHVTDTYVADTFISKDNRLPESSRTNPGYLSFVLHAHLPFVRHPEYRTFLEERWLFEAISETYLPFLKMCRRLADDGIQYRLTVSISPTLSAMLTDELLQNRYVEHLLRLIDLSDYEIKRNAGDDAYDTRQAMSRHGQPDHEAGDRGDEDKHGRQVGDDPPPRAG